MGWYDSKFVECGGQERISCCDWPTDGCGARDLNGLPAEERARFAYYTDG